MATTHVELVSEMQFRVVTCTMLVLASIFTIAHIVVQIWRRKSLQIQDYLLYAAYVFFLALSITYLAIIPMVFEIGRVRTGVMRPWANMAADVVKYIRAMFVTTTLFWLSLWMVKLSLLALYKKLVVGLPMIYIRLWWAVFIFCLISLVGCIVSYLTSCEDFAASMQTGSCKGPRSLQGQLASLYTSYAVDVFSDFLIMFIPIRIVWNLQVPQGQKMAIILLFASGFVCIAFATLRVAQIGRQSGESSSPNPIWLALWTVIEAAVAVCIGCGPAFVTIYRAARSTKISRDANGYQRNTHTSSGDSPFRPDLLRLNTISVGAGRARKNAFWDDTRSSQEALAVDDKRIIVTTSLHQDQEPKNDRRPASPD